MRILQLFIFSAFVFFALFAVAAEERALPSILSDIDVGQNSVSAVDRETLTAMMEYADKQKKTIFELLNESALFLKEQGIRVRIEGTDLRHLKRRFVLGGDRVNTLLPVEKIGYIEIGAVLEAEQAEMDVFLFEKHSDFLELGDFFLAEHFGFESLEDAWYRGGFGVRVKYLFMSFRLVELNLYDERKIAIWVEGVPKPKRWRIDPIKKRAKNSL
ncbi:hypothetical protein [Marispirochaeta sp.]|jgi:hypothetical protein|uniref:hypothetical protein n=1 Tax=Marispirochaeta sp. TaxID=2038653 RepID=UPI0029C7378B|nr:hypothetical protein [Marispirochaeta sp.]